MWSFCSGGFRFVLRGVFGGWWVCRARRVLGFLGLDLLEIRFLGKFWVCFGVILMVHHVYCCGFLDLLKMKTNWFWVSWVKGFNLETWGRLFLG